jgi:hypothetical protein
VVVDFCQVKFRSGERASVLSNHGLDSFLFHLISLKSLQRIQPSSPLIEKPARPLVPTALHSAFLALHSTRLQTSKSRHARSLTRGASIGTTTSAKGLGDAAKGVVGEVGLRRSHGAAEAARGALFRSLEAFFDGEELGFESGKMC